MWFTEWCWKISGSGSDVRKWSVLIDDACVSRQSDRARCLKCFRAPVMAVFIGKSESVWFIKLECVNESTYVWLGMWYCTVLFVVLFSPKAGGLYVYVSMNSEEAMLCQTEMQFTEMVQLCVSFLCLRLISYNKHVWDCCMMKPCLYLICSFKVFATFFLQMSCFLRMFAFCFMHMRLWFDC